MSMWLHLMAESHFLSAVLGIEPRSLPMLSKPSTMSCMQSLLTFPFYFL